MAVVGLGYVGLPLAVAFAEAGFRVVGIDLDAARVAQLNAGRSYIADVPSSRLEPLTREPTHGTAGGCLTAAADFGALAEAAAVVVCVPTPLGKTRDPDMSCVTAAVEQAAAHLHPGMLLVLESTTYPGTTDELVLPRLEEAYRRQNGSAAGPHVGSGFFVAFSPERIDPGRTDWTLATMPKVIGGVTPQCLRVAVALYSSIVPSIVPVSSPRVAEMVKLLENTFRAVNIGLVNELAIMCDRLGVDVWEVIAAAATKPFGFMPFYPGPGLGGHCIPVDPHYLSWKLRTLNYNARFVQLASEVNYEMPRHVVDKVVRALNDAGRAVGGARVLVLGVTYKPDVSDVRESPALQVLELLQGWGADVAYHDPYVPRLSVEGVELRSVALQATELERADCVVVVTDHAAYDWVWIASRSRLVVDTRNALCHVAAGACRIVKL
ncbi:MAG: nucleotide sugar dehydrogenase [Candidatus Latescibacterota bacterium]